MSGWDTSSRPSWERPEGQEDSGTQAFSVPDLAAGDDPWAAPASSASPPPEFFPDYGQQQEPPRPGSRQEPDLPRRGRHHAATAAPDAGYGREPGFGQDMPYGQEAPYTQDTAYGAEAGAGLDTAYGQDSAYRQDSAHGQDAGYGQDAMPRQESAVADWDRPGDGTGGRLAAGPPWEDGPRQDPGQGPARPRFDTPEFGPADGDRGRLGPGRRDVGRELDRRGDSAGRPGWGQQAPSGGARPDREPAAQIDPALQDFFAPQQSRPGVPPSGNGRRVPGASLQGLGQPGSGLPGSGFPGSGLPGGPGGPGRPAANGRRPWTDGWEASRDAPAASRDALSASRDALAASRDALAASPRRAGTLPPRRTGGHGGRPPTAGGGGGRRQIYYWIGGGVAVLVVVGVFFATHNSNPSSTDTNTPPAVTPSTSVTKHAAKPTPPATPATPAGPAYTLSAPATAGGYPTGQDPHFLATATTTAQGVVSAVSSGGGGTVKGAPVSASYRLPTGEQVLEFVGYQGTFNPAKIETLLASLGSDPHTYPAGPHGGILGCANTTSSPSGAVCVWATSSTLGVTEFFNVSGPETLTSSQSKGAQIVVNLRSGVETAKS